MKRGVSILSLLVITGLLLASCGGGQEAASPETVLADGVATMSGLAGYQYQLSHTGPTVFIDPEKTAQFVEASGHFVAPDKATTKVKISAMGMVVEITVISIGDAQWGSNPLSGAFQELDPAYLFKPVQYLDPLNGFFPSLGSGLADLSLVAEEELEELPGVPLQHLAGTIPGAVIAEVSQGLISVDSLAADLWIDTASGQIPRVVLVDQAGGAEPSSWTFDFWGFGETIEITAP